jgi:leucyl-tRNA synthetase
VLAPEHPLVDELTAVEQRSTVRAYQREVQSKDIVSRRVGDKTKTGVFVGSYARNPATGEAIPIWIADYVLMEYGTGAIMAVPAHDKRDFEFATQFKLPIRQVVNVEGEPLPSVSEGGVLMNSGAFDGMPCADGAKRIVSWLAERGLATPRVQYRLHDWCISRQRYWGPPIPIIYCEQCGVVPVPEKDLPVELPLIEDFRPDDTGVSPLARHEEWYFVKCPQCGERARRETDVSDTFLDSAWYFLRYPSTEYDDRPFDVERTRKWLPVSTYIGGNEHAVLHLLYSRFTTMVLHDLGYLDFEEPYRVFRAHGLIVKDGAKMSKSRGNVVVPDDYIARWGADAFRMYLMFLGPFQEGGDFRDDGLNGPRRFLDKLWALVQQSLREDAMGGEIHHPILVKWHQTKKKVTQDMERLGYNTAIAAQMELLNTMREANCAERAIVEEMILMVAPFAPHFAEEAWERLGHERSIFEARWPVWDESLTVEDTVELAVQVNGKTRGKVTVRRDATEAEAVAAVKAEPSIAKFLDGKTVRKTILVPNRLVNLVVQ